MGNDSPTQPGVLDEPKQDLSKQEQPEQQEQDAGRETPKSARELAMEAITAKRNAQFEEETNTKLSADEAPAPTVEAPPAPQDELDKQLQKQLEVPQSRVFKLKVDGQEIDMPEDQLVEIAQKNLAADRRLREATELLKQAEERAKAPPPAAPAAPAPQPEPPKPSKDDLVQRAKKIVSATLEGREDDAALELAELLAAQTLSPAPGPSEPQVGVDEVSARVLQKLSDDRALAKSQTDYPELYSDPMKNRFGASLIKERMDKGIPFSAAIEEVGAELAKTFGWTKPGHQEPTAAQPQGQKPSESKQEKKATIDVVAGVNATSASNEEPPQSLSERIAEMAKQRQPWLYK